MTHPYGEPIEGLHAHRRTEDVDLCPLPDNDFLANLQDCSSCPYYRGASGWHDGEGNGERAILCNWPQNGSERDERQPSWEKGTQLDVVPGVFLQAFE